MAHGGHTLVTLVVAEPNEGSERGLFEDRSSFRVFSSYGIISHIFDGDTEGMPHVDLLKALVRYLFGVKAF